MSLKILSLPVDNSACGYYRIRKPLKAIKAVTESDTEVIDYAKTSMDQLIKALPSIDIIYMRPGSEMAMEKLREIPGMPELKAKWVMDIDDNTDVISPYSEFYSEFGQEEYKVGDVWLWKNGERGFSTMNNASRVAKLHWGMKNADLVTVTTELLAEHARKFNPNVYVNDNTIDFNHWWRLDHKINNPLKVVWQGSPSHYEDWYSIKDPLNKLMGEYNFELIMLGSNYKGIFEERFLPRVKSLPWVHFEAHSYRMMSLQADIGIIPLADLPFNWYKSSIKWYENAAMGVPSLVSNILPYANSIEDGKTAMGYKTPQEFYDKLKTLLTNKGLRANMANNAYQWVKKNKSQDDQAIALEKRLAELCQK